MLHDGICDCCDSSDEDACDNTCSVLRDTQRTRIQHQLDLQLEGNLKMKEIQKQTENEYEIQWKIYKLENIKWTQWKEWKSRINTVYDIILKQEKRMALGIYPIPNEEHSILKEKMKGITCHDLVHFGQQTILISTSKSRSLETYLQSVEECNDVNDCFKEPTHLVTPMINRMSMSKIKGMGHMVLQFCGILKIKFKKILLLNDND